LQEYVPNVSVVLVLCCSTCFHGRKLQVFYLMLHMFYTYVASVCSKCFIHFIRMLHSNILYCTCFILFGESMSAGSDGGTTQTLENGSRRDGGQRSGRDGGE
jgi:hypothetical protein